MTKNRRQRSRSRAGLDESSGDELADTAILYNVPHRPSGLPPSHSLGTMTPDEITRPDSVNAIEGISRNNDKSLPLTPQKDSSKEPTHRQKRRPALAKKTTNMKIVNGRAPELAKPQISLPVLQETTNSAITVPNGSRPVTSHISQSVPDAADLNRKISALMERAAAQEEQTKLKAESYVSASAKASPLVRSKIALVKATRAIKERLNNGNVEKTSVSKRPITNRHSSYQGYNSEEPLSTRWHYEVLHGMSRERLDRRIAEGENLSNPKIKNLTGDGNIPRKPLPVYESMRSRSIRSDPTGDPFSDDTDANDIMPRQDYSGFRFDFNKEVDDGSDNRNSMAAVEASKKTDNNSSQPSNENMTTTYPTPKFSNMISGLSQHPDVMCFSSSPLSHSTPRVRYETPCEVDREPDQLAPSVLSDSGEKSTHDARKVPSSPQHHQARLSDGSNLSIKRKEATEDLRAQLEPMAKKAKTDSNHSKDDLELVSGINGLATEEEGTSHSTQSVDLEASDSFRNTNKRKGMNIFDVGKGKAAESKDDDEPIPKTRLYLNAVKRSSITRPNSSLFNRGRNFRSGVHRLAQADGYSMDIDELQVDDASYQIGGKKR